MDVELTKISEFVQGLDDLIDIGNAVVYGVDQRGNSVKIEVSRLTDKTALETRVTTLETGKANTVHTHTSSQVTDLQSFVSNAIADKADKSELTPIQNGVSANSTAISTINNKIGSANGIAELDTNGKVPQTQLPSFVDDVEEYSTLSNFPATGESGKIYIATDTNITYRWGGSTYVAIGSDLALGETASTAYRGDRGKTAYEHSQTQGNPHNTTLLNLPTVQAALDNKQNKIGKNEFLKQVNDLYAYTEATNGEIVQFVGTDNRYQYQHGYIYERDTSWDIDNATAKIFSTDFVIGNKTFSKGIYFATGGSVNIEEKTCFKTNGTFAWISPARIGDTLVNINTGEVTYITAVDNNYNPPFPQTDSKGVNVRNSLCMSGQVFDTLTEYQNSDGLKFYFAASIVILTNGNNIYFNIITHNSFPKYHQIGWRQIDVQPHQDLSSIENPTWTDESGTYSDVPQSSNNIQSEWTLSAIFARIKKWFASLKKVAFSGNYNDLSNKPQNATTTTAGLMSAEDKSILIGYFKEIIINQLSTIIPANTPIGLVKISNDIINIDIKTYGSWNVATMGQLNFCISGRSQYGYGIVQSGANFTRTNLIVKCGLKNNQVYIWVVFPDNSYNSSCNIVIYGYGAYYAQSLDYATLDESEFSNINYLNINAI